MPTPTRRTLVVAILGAIPIVLTPSHDLALTLAILWLLACGLAALVDARMAPGADSLRLTRSHDDALSLGAWNTVTLRAANASGRHVRIQVRDAVPQLMAQKGTQLEVDLPAGGSWEAEYQLYPMHRGKFALGPLTVRILGPLGLAWRETSLLSSDPVQVYPNILAVRQYEALLRSGRLFETGIHRSRSCGEGTEFERLRQYTPDDEYRRIDWKATARRASLIVADQQVERSQSIVFALDVGRMMSMRVPLPPSSDVAGAAVGTPPLTRLDYSLNAALLLSYVAQSHGDRVGAVAFADSVTRFVPPRSGRSQFVTLTEALYDLEPQPTETEFTDATAALRAGVNRRSLIVFFTDVVDSESSTSLTANLALLSRRHLCLVVTLQDPGIRSLAEQVPANSKAVYERAVARRVLDERTTAMMRLRAHGVLTLDVSADCISASVINEYLDIKRRGSL